MNANSDGRDDEARRQIRDLLDASFVVEAGAGTGKTSVLVERVVALVRGGRNIERLVAITFTDKAAAELRDRVRRGLEAALAQAAPGSGPAGSIAAALDSLDRAHISTIHAFCQSLLRQFAPELSVDPAYEVQDEVLAGRRFEEMWRVHLEQLGRDEGARRAVDRALDLGLTTRDMATLGAALWQQPELAPLLQASPFSVTPPAWPDLDALLQPLHALPLSRVPEHDRLRSAIARLMASVEALRPVEQEREAGLVAVVSALPESFAATGRRENWGDSASLGLARDAAQSVAVRLKELLAALRAEALAGILGYIVGFVVDDAKARGREGKLVFDDLILRVRELLQTHPTARAAVRERFDCLLIDEFQDTDPLQVEIALAFARDPRTGRLEPGRLFLVGDPKQSIYRFRRADMAVYSATRDLMQAGGSLVAELKHNRRSRSDLVQWVNRVLGEVIGAGDAPEFQPPYREIEAVRSSRLRGPGVAWFGGAIEKPARDVRREEAAAIARQVRAAIADGWEVEERATGEIRKAGFRDIAILVPTRAILLSLERALQDTGVPYRVEGGSLVYGTQEVRDIINCLTAIDDPADEVAVVAALRSPAYACSDVELAEFRLDGGRFDYLDRRLDGREGKVADGLRSLRYFHESRHERSLASLIERFLADRGLVEVGILDQADRNAFRRARFVVEQARAFEAGGPESLRAFVSWLERRSSRAVLDNEGAGLDDDEDAVRVLTIHGAKGLEFPIVFLGGLGWSPGNERRVFGIDRATREIAVSLGAQSRGAVFTLGPVDQINNQEAQHLKSERDRLLYVAATRARDHLVLSLYHKQGAHESAAARLLQAGARDGSVELPDVPSVSGARPNPFESIDVEAAASIEEFDAERDRLVAESRVLVYTSATALGRDWKKETSDDSEPWARGRGGTHLGRAVHATLQSVGWDASEEEISAVARAQAVAEAVPERAAEVAALVRRALAMPAAARARAARRALREVPFAMRLDGVLVEGFVDVVIDSEDGLELIDWKTDDVSEQEAPARLHEYALQAGLYALGLEAAAKRRVSRLTYVFVRPGLELSPGDPAKLAARAREAVLSGR